MFRGRLLFACLTAFIMLVPPVTCQLKKHDYSPPSSCGNIRNISCPFRLKGDPQYCPPSSCGNIRNISYPFRLKGDPQYCGHHSYELSCENNITTILLLYSGRYYVEEINYNNLTMRVVDTGIQRHSCSVFPLYSLTEHNFSFSNLSFPFSKPYQLVDYHNTSTLITFITFISCETPVNFTLYLDTAVCNSENSSLNSSSLSLQRHTYIVYGRMRPLDVEYSCSIWKVVQGSWASNTEQKNDNISIHSIQDKLVSGFYLWWYPSIGDCELVMNICYLYGQCSTYYHICGFFMGPKNWLFAIIASCSYLVVILIILILFVVAKLVCCSPCVFAFLVYKWRRRHLSMYDSIEDFIQSHNKLMPVRYSYSDIKKMTKGFKDKLGEGGYGSVYKGKIRSGHLVAVKILGNSKANGQDFINEVATIGTIHHVNVAQLIGFCAERSKRALVYDFMPNGSLEKYIFPREEGIIFLSLEKLYAISLGIARGIEYLHGGCDMQILHFDIKPHNILLDEKFMPKVSDFGLAKLYPTDDSIVNLTAARGTMGYMAPELFYKNIGGVSYKADVYSFGMLLMEMASKRKNLNPFVEHLSQIYFPSWVYDQYSEGKDIEMGDTTEEERKIAKKMITVAFWCIQLKPTDRPSMSKVVEMLEGNVELQMPPKPFLSPQEISVEDHGINVNSTE